MDGLYYQQSEGQALYLHHVFIALIESELDTKRRCLCETNCI